MATENTMQFPEFSFICQRFRKRKFDDGKNCCSGFFPPTNKSFSSIDRVDIDVTATKSEY